MRGAPHPTPGDAKRTRIIPADAGSTIIATSRISHLWDHPRGCGEHWIIKGTD